MASGFGLERARGALVREVVDGGPAANAGVKPGDVIVQFEGKRIEDSYELPLLAGDAGVGKSVKLDLLRDGKPQSVAVVLGGHPDNTKVAKAHAKREPAKDKDGSLGVTVVTLDSDDRDRLKFKAETTGSRITKVRPGSAAFMSGLQVDDVVVLVNGKEVKTANDFAAAVQATANGGLLKVTVRRGASTLFVPVLKP
jgi:serine protease Do